jgi:hypothetical protein
MKLTEEKTMAHSQNEKCCDFCRIGRINKRALRIAFRQDTDLGHVSCLADIPVGACDRCGWQIWSQDAETITEDAVRREYVKLLSARRRSSDPYQNDARVESNRRSSLYPYASLAQLRCN